MKDVTEFKKINTMPKTIDERLAEIMQVITFPKPKTKEEALIVYRKYQKLRRFYDKRMLIINRDILPELREMIK